MSATNFLPGTVLHAIAAPGHWSIQHPLAPDDTYAVALLGDPFGRQFRAHAWDDGYLNVQGRLIAPREAEPGMRLVNRDHGTRSSESINAVTGHEDSAGVTLFTAAGPASFRDDTAVLIEVTLPECHPQAFQFGGPAVHRPTAEDLLRHADK